jgi:hypothetical protein
VLRIYGIKWALLRTFSHRFDSGGLRNRCRVENHWMKMGSDGKSTKQEETGWMMGDLWQKASRGLFALIVDSFLIG